MTDDGALVCDVLVAGSGAAGLTAAITAAHFGLDVIVAEKDATFGGTSAWSGGWLWIPHNPLAEAAGIHEGADGPRTYLRSEIGAAADDERITAFLKNGPEMVEFLARNSAVEWVDGNGVPDFHASEGSRAGGRSVSVAAYDIRELGPEMNRLRPPLDIVSLWGMPIQSGAEIGHFFRSTRNLRSAFYVARRLARHFRDLIVYRRATRTANGNALVARLLRSALDKKVRLMDSAPIRELLSEDGRVTGAILATDKGSLRVIARQGVVLATGGFPHDKARLSALVPHAGADGAGHASAATRTNTGDGMRLGENAGGKIPTDFPSAVALSPVSLVPDGQGGFGHFPHLIERAKPGIIAVTPEGQRFVNEADSYYDFMAALLAITPEGEAPHAWIIADHRAQRRWGLGWAKPFPFPVGPAIRSGYLKRGRTLDELAAACGMDPALLKATVSRFNDQAASGIDPDFNRGQSHYNKVQGDSAHKPNPSLAPLAKAPFYAVRVMPGSLGTFAGLTTNERTQVTRADGTIISGLYAVGNDMASIMGGYYPSGGITLGPGMTFGYIAGRVLAGQSITHHDSHNIKEQIHDIP